MRLHHHQSDAITAAHAGDNYVLTTGTGSGKSLSYIVPIVDHVLRRGSGKGIQAIIIYPMNALANSQYNELEKFLVRGFPEGKQPVTFARYTGQENEATRQQILAHPPDIILTNYVMLELIMTRPHDQKLIRSARDLQFLVLDELHTYRGRQGADVAMLIRRVREACQSSGMQVVGTSATLADGGSFAEQQQLIAETAGRLFGAPVKPERVIGETLRRATPNLDFNDSTIRGDLRIRIENDQPFAAEYAAFCQDPLSSWLETTFGLELEAGSDRLRRAKPRPIQGVDGAANLLAKQTGLPEPQCARIIEKGLLAGYEAEHPETGFPAFAFRLHQFISRGDVAYASLEAPADRYITLNGQKFVPDGQRDRVLLPLAFCRECGQEYYVVKRLADKDGHLHYVPRDLRDQMREEDEERGFLYLNPERPWPDERAELIERELLPEDWLEQGPAGLRLKSSQVKNLPQNLKVNKLGIEDGGQRVTFVKSPFRFCLNCGVVHGNRVRADFGKLATLSSEGRSTATTVLSLAALAHLRRDESLEQKAKKLLSFTDNRQDASLQAGHFNDFVEIGLLRAALFRAARDAGPNGLQHDDLAPAVFAALNLPPRLYASEPDARYSAQRQTEEALRGVLAYRLYQDLRRGWRVTAPNLEQCGLLHIEYPDLPFLAEDPEPWQGRHPALVTASVETRQNVLRVLLDYLRRELVIKVDYLEESFQERIQQRSSQRLIEPWSIDESETMTHGSVAFPSSRLPGVYRGNLYVSPRGSFGTFLRRQSSFPEWQENLDLEAAGEIIEQLFEILRFAGIVEVVQTAGQADLPGYQLVAAAMTWRAGNGLTPYHDPLRMPRRPREGSETNPFFLDYYRQVAADLLDVEAREHTAQVPSEERLKREARFRSADLPVLYCSPTMELGVDISQLNVVNMRNVPPTPANYAQRSGRAGRSGQPALVFTYCTSGSPHDQYFFHRPHQMVAGQVAPPRLDLANEDLLKAHIQAVWLTVSGKSLGRSLQEVLDLSQELLPLQESFQQTVDDPQTRIRARQRLTPIMEQMAADLTTARWYDDGWLDRTLQQIPITFNEACDRWRSLYQAARQQQATQHAIMSDPTRSSPDKQMARRLRAEAERQLELLTGQGERISQSDFYSYRYFASEGFLPGYNFPRLPLSAYIPGRRGRRGDDDEFLQRPRFLAISEFGPQSIIYHEGSRYVINQVILPVTGD
ncbi:MAG: DEAD/DEAH box helicase, partial [Anaerolineales bacterium]|nr:DEAD/DEAH box helicase [Anaerolineales bacterium]